MTFPEIGQKAKSRSQTYPKIGVIESIDGDTVTLRSNRRFASSETFTLKIDDLQHVCQETVYNNYSFSECGRLAKEGNLCGLHAGVEKRRKKAAERRRQQTYAAAEEAVQRRLLLQEARERAANLGITESTAISINSLGVPVVSITLDALEQLLKK